MRSFKFSSIIKKPTGTANWFYTDIPINTWQEFGKKGVIKINARIYNISFESSLLPHKNGTHYLMIPSQVAAQLDLAADLIVELIICIKEEMKL